MAGSASSVVPGSRERVRHYYHVYADGYWKHILDDHLKALKDSGITWDLVVGVVGSEESVQEVALQLPEETRIVGWPDGFEQHTLNLIYDDVQAGYDGPVLYAHTKGAGYPSAYSTDWRQCMTRLVLDAEDCMRRLGEGSDTVGCHWLTRADWPGRIKTPFYGGNFWWATSDHLRRLARPQETNRFDAEAWLASVRPRRPVSLVSGWPGPGCHTHI